MVTRPLALEPLGRWQQRPGETVAPLQMLNISVKLNFPSCFLQFRVNLASPIQFKPLADAKNGLTGGQSSLALLVPPEREAEICPGRQTGLLAGLLLYSWNN